MLEKVAETFLFVINLIMCVYVFVFPLCLLILCAKTKNKQTNKALQDKCM